MFDNVAALFLDLDGTLVDSVPDLTAAINLMLRQLDLPTREEAQVRDWVG
ncbi:MAG: phosphoglycolate phosphatase, partial [Candidatus Competibacteraceae bacterium]